jgi:hypothetical protein
MFEDAILCIEPKFNQDRRKSMGTWRKIAAVLAAIALLIATGCSGPADSSGDTDTPPSSGTYSAPAQPTPSAPTVPMADAGTTFKRGAAAAPLAVGYTQVMYNNFALSVVYETTKNQDMALLETLDASGAPLGYQYGRDVCDEAANKTKLNTIADNLSVNTGLTLGGAQAVIAGAVRHMCGIVALRGYLTYFDSQVIDAQMQIHKVTGVMIEESAVGWAARVVCDYLSYYGQSAGLRTALDTFKPYGTERIGLPFAQGEDNFDRVITTVASGWCMIDAELLGATYYH